MNNFQLALTIIMSGGCAALLLHRFWGLARALYLIATAAGCLLALVCLLPLGQDYSSLAWSWSWLHTFTLSFRLDSVSVFFQIPVLLVCPLAAIYSYHYLQAGREALKSAISMLFFNLLLVSMLLVTAADNLLTFALAWEIMSLSSYFLVMYDYQKTSTRDAGYLYLVFSQAGALCIFAALAVIYAASGSFSFSGAAALPEPVKLLVFFLALAGFGSKAGIFPVHIWLPHAHPAAPSHVSAVMSGVMIKMGIYGLLRFYIMLDIEHVLPGQAVLVFGMISGVLGVLYALGKHNIKRLLAYHSVENIGIILIGFGLGMIGLSTGNQVMAGFGFAGGLLHVLNHSIFKSLLFLGAGSVIKATGISHLDQLGGLLKRMPITGSTFITGSVSISGLPPFNGFISEFLIYFAAFNGLAASGINLLLIILAIVSLAVIGGLAAACFTKVIGIVFLGEPRSLEPVQAREAGIGMTAPMIFLALLCLVIGVLPGPFITLAFQPLSDFQAAPAVDAALIDSLGAGLALAARVFLTLLLVVTITRKLLYRRKKISSAPTWGCGFTQPTARMQYTGTSYAMSIVDFYRPFVRIRTAYSGISTIFPGKTTYSTRVDDIAESGLSRLLVLPLLSILAKLRWIQHGNIQLYIGYILLTIVVLLLVLLIL